MLKRRTIRGKLMFLLTFAMISLLAVGGLGVYGMVRITNNEKEMQQAVHNALEAEQVVTLLMDLRIQLRECLVSNTDPDALNAALTRMAEIDVGLEALIPSMKGNMTNTASQEPYDTLLDLHNFLMTVRPGYYELARAGDVEGMGVWLRTYVGDALHFQELGENIRDFEDAQAKVYAVRNDRLTALLTTSTTLLLVVCAVLLMALGLYIVRQISTPIRKMARASEQLALGDVEVDVRTDCAGEIGVLSEAFQKMADSIAEQARVLEAVADGDYTVSAMPRSDKDLIGRSIARLVRKGNEIISTITSISSMVSSSSEQLAEAAGSLSSGSSQQHSTLEGFSNTLHNVLRGAEQHGAVTVGVMDYIEQLERMVHRSDKAMEEILRAMQSISDSATAVSSINKVISDIAFQTNILALNASVEAARAGQHGKGFAVVADEVRNLAAKSAAAAEETTRLIDGSQQRVAEGSAQVTATNEIIEEMKRYLGQSHEMFGEVVDCPIRREATSEMLENSVTQLVQVVQGNLSLAEETSATSEELSAQSSALNELMKEHFKLHGAVLPGGHAPKGQPQQADSGKYDAPRGGFSMSPA